MKLTLRLTLTILFIAATANCGSGRGGSTTPSRGTTSSPGVPVLSSLNLYPNTVTQDELDGTVKVNFSFLFQTDKDLVSMTITVYDSDGVELDSATGKFGKGTGIKEGYIHGSFDGDRSEPATYKIEIFVTDSDGRQSNRISELFTVLPGRTLVSIAVTPLNAFILTGSTQQFTATATFSDNSTTDITSRASWTSSNTNIAIIDSKGFVTGSNAGSTAITATFRRISGSADIQIVVSFAAGVRYPVTTPLIFGLGNTAIGDLNGDAKNDVAVLDGYWGGSHIYIYYQNSLQSMDSPQTVTTDLYLTGIAIADVNNDGLSDLIVSGNSRTAASGSSGGIYVYEQEKTHTLGAPIQYTVTPNQIWGLAIADLNNDSQPDIVASGVDEGGNGVVSFLFQSENGTLAPEKTYTGTSIYDGGELHVADMNNDGLNDIVVQSGSNVLAVIKQVSGGIFSTTVDFYTVRLDFSRSFKSFALGDLNGDRRTDIAAAEPGNGGYLNVFVQDSNGQLVGQTLNILPYATQDEVHIADLDGDGFNDIVTLSDGNLVQIRYQNPEHTFVNMKTYYLPTSSHGGTFVHQALSIGDVTNDGLPDIVASWSVEGVFVLPRLP